MATKITNPSVPEEQVSTAEDTRPVSTTEIPVEESVTAHTYVETITFRSRNEYFARPEKVEIILPSKDGRKIHPEMFKEKRTPIS